MSEQFGELEERIGYHFHNQDYLRRALACPSAINERHGDAANQNFEVLEFLGDAALKYAIATNLYLHTGNYNFISPGNIHDKVRSYIDNSNLTRIGKELNLRKYIIKGKGVPDTTDKMLGDAVEEMLGAIVIDQQEKGNPSENALFDVFGRIFSIQVTRRSTPSVQNNSNKKGCSCCKFLGIIFLMIIFVGIMFLVKEYAEL